MTKRSDKLGNGQAASGGRAQRDASRSGLTPPSKLATKVSHKVGGKAGRKAPTKHAAPHESDAGASHEHDDLWGDDDAMEGMGGGLALAGGGSGACNEGLNAKVLVLNRGYAAMRVVSAKRAFVLLARNIAEVIHVDMGGHAETGAGQTDSEPDRQAQGAVVQGHYVNYDFASWAELSQLQAQLERERHDWVRTVRYDIAVPRIIRLLAYDKLPEHGVKLNRRNLFARDRNKCQYCGRIFSTSDLSIDHVLPRAQGGKDSWENLVCSCIRCNARKGGRTPDQASMRLIRKPEKPRRNPLITLRLGHEKYSSWRAFLDHAYWSVELG